MAVPQTKIVNFTSNIFERAEDDTLIAWLSGINLSPALITSGERASWKAGINYSSLTGVASSLQISLITVVFDTLIDVFSDSWNSALADYIGKTDVAINLSVYELGTSNPFTVLSGPRAGNIYTRSTFRGTAAYTPTITASDRTSLTNEFTSDPEYIAFPAAGKPIILEFWNDLLDLIISQIESASSTVSLYDYHITTIGIPTATAASEVAPTSFKANWNAVSTVGGLATTYTITVSSDSGFSTIIFEETVSTLYKNITGLSPSTTYYYRVVSRNSVSYSVPSNTITAATTAYASPTTPTALPASEITSTSFKANYTSSIGATGYTITISTNPSFSTSTSITTTSLSVPITGLLPFTIYYYKVTATTPVTSSSPSLVITVITTAAVAGISATGTDIYASQYTSIRTKIASILGSGSGQRGYGQPVLSNALTINPGTDITKNQWDLLRYDLINAKVHQDGVSPSIVTVASGDFIGYGAGYPNNNYDTIAEQAILNRFNIGAGRSVLSLATMTGQTATGVISRTGSWTTQSQCTLTLTFSTANEARYFFNSGGKIRFTSARTGGTTSPQNTQWTNLLSTTAGTINFGAQTPAIVNFYSLTTAYQQWYTVSASSPYAANFYRIEALCNCTDPTNVNGTASVITFRITWGDSYVDVDPTPPGDLVDGTLSLTVEEFKATGSLIPSGSFTITSPSYSISAITAT